MMEKETPTMLKAIRTPEAELTPAEAISGIFGHSVFRLDAACRLLNVHKQMIAYLKQSLSPSTNQQQLYEAGLKACVKALSDLYHFDAASMLNASRKLAAGDPQHYKIFDAKLSPKVLGAESETEAVTVLAQSFQKLIILLEPRVKREELNRTLASYGIVLDENGIRLNNVPPFNLHSPPKQFLGAWGVTFHKWLNGHLCVNRHLEDDNPDKKRKSGEVWEMCFQDIVEKIAAVSPNCTPRNLSVEQEAHISLVTAIQWVECGMPIIQPSHKLAASLMGTQVPKELLPDVVVPWPFFLVEVPDGILPGIGKHAAYVGLATEGNQFSFLVFGKEQSFVNTADIESLSDLADLKMPCPPGADEQEHIRLVKLLGRLLLGSMIELDDEEHKNKIRRGPSSHPMQHDPRSGRPPSAWIFQIKREVKVDARPYVYDYIEKGKKSLSVQVFVRGFRRRQPYGPRNSLRRWQHIEPYWKGKVDSPIAVRPHKL